MVPESEKVKRVRQQISALAAETRMTSGNISSYNMSDYPISVSMISILLLIFIIHFMKKEN